MMALRRILVAAVATMCVGSATAAEASGFYVGALAGSMDFDDLRKNEFTWGLLSGWQFNKNFSAELGYYRPDSTNFEGVLKISTYTIATSLIGSYPFNGTWSIFGRLGAAFWESKVTATDFYGETRSSSYSTTELLYGGGLSMSLKRFQLRLEYQVVDAKLTNPGLVSLGFVIPIGK